jgi:hypothetical protein
MTNFSSNRFGDLGMALVPDRVEVRAPWGSGRRSARWMSQIIEPPTPPGEIGSNFEISCAAAAKEFATILQEQRLGTALRHKGEGRMRTKGTAIQPKGASHHIRAVMGHDCRATVLAVSFRVNAYAWQY